MHSCGDAADRSSVGVEIIDDGNALNVSAPMHGDNERLASRVSCDDKEIAPKETFPAGNIDVAGTDSAATNGRSDDVAVGSCGHNSDGSVAGGEAVVSPIAIASVGVRATSGDGGSQSRAAVGGMCPK